MHFLGKKCHYQNVVPHMLLLSSIEDKIVQVCTENGEFSWKFICVGMYKSWYKC